jgi:hypothetical protein
MIGWHIEDGGSFCWVSSPKKGWGIEKRLGKTLNTEKMGDR